MTHPTDSGTDQQDQQDGRSPSGRACALRAEPAAQSQAKPLVPDAIVLVRANDPGRKPQLYACGKCGAVHSPNIYACRDDMAHEAARKAAEDCYNCREHNECNVCGCVTPKGWLRCEKCRYAVKLAAAVEVPDDGGPYCSFDGDTYYQEMEEAADAGLEWVSPCHVTYPRIDADSVLEGLLDDMHEDASVDDLDAVEPFIAAVKAFNEAQRCQSWFGDPKRKIRVTAQGTETRSDETERLGPKGDGPVAKPCAPETPND